ncbi:hypothetical protein HGA88_01825 [Candidatus Roizmanbacteria bacterium]|nr:hypothetical protein [Candidatus Roizmanbacteria bacterium]
MSKSGGYEINQKDIEGVLNFLKITDPENATPEMAIELLEYLKTTIHTMSHDDPEKLKEMYEALKKQKALSRN